MVIFIELFMQVLAKNKYKRMLTMAALVILASVFNLASPSMADTTSCPNSICISVTTDPNTGKIIITGKKEIASKSTTTVHVLSTKRTLPVAPKSHPVIHKTPTTTHIQPVHRQVAGHRAIVHRQTMVKKKINTTAGISLSDQISQLIPGGGIFTTPSRYPLVNTPITIWSSNPNSFSTTSLILGVPVQLFLTPTFSWNFGDGSTSTTHDAGAPYPHGEITHTYSKPGNYLITLQVSWWGSWVANNITTNLPGGSIFNNYQYPVTVITAPSRFTS
jgi:hypothetical protein